MVVGSPTASTLDASSDSPASFLALFGGHAADAAAAVGERFGEFMDEHQLRVADADHVAGLQHVIAVDQFRADQRAVAAVEIAHGPLPAGHEHFHVRAAATFVLDDDLIRRRAADQAPIVPARAERHRSISFLLG